jgi:hypothetical protein
MKDMSFETALKTGEGSIRFQMVDEGMAPTVHSDRKTL